MNQAKWIAAIITAAMDLWPEVQTALKDGHLSEEEIERLLNIAARSAVLGLLGSRGAMTNGRSI